MKVAIVVGHNEGATGADAIPPVSMSEFAFNSMVANLVMRSATRGHGIRGAEVKVFFRKASGSYHWEIDTVYAEVNRWTKGERHACSLELHFNSARYDVQGTETLCSHSSGSKQLANCMQEAMVEGLGFRNRGVKPTNKSERGGRSLYAGRPPAVLLEPFFGSNRESCQRIMAIDGPHGLAAIYLKGLAAYKKEVGA